MGSYLSGASQPISPLSGGSPATFTAASLDMRHPLHPASHLAVKAIRDTAVSRNGVAKVLELEGPLESTGKEAT